MALTKNSQIDLNGNEMILDADGDTTITADTDDQIDIKVGGTDTVVITGGAMALKGATPTLTIGDAGAEDTKIVFDGNAQDFYIGLDDSADDLLIGLGSTVGTTPAISIDENLKATLSGDVEIGTTAPKINLKNTDTSIIADQSLGVIEVESSDGSTGSAGTIAKLDIAASGAFDGSGHGSEFRFTTGATNQSGSIALSEVMRISSTGKTSFSANGIGSTATQDRDFTFYSEGSTNGVDIRSNDYRLALIGAGASSGTGMDKGYMALYNEGTNTVALNTNGDSYFNGGGLAIGTTSIDNTTRLTVVQPNNDYPVARFDMSGAVNAIVGQEIRVTDNAANAANKFFIRGLDDTTTLRFEARTNGGIANYQSNDSNLSDERLKTEIKDAPDCLDIINNLRVTTFKYKDQNINTKTNTGLIAQEVEKVDPSLIDLNGWNEESPEGEEPYKSLHTTDLMFKMLKAMQEQQEQIEALQSEINTLKGG